MVEPANERGWGWPGAPDSAADRKYRRDHLVWAEAGGVRLLIRKEVADLFVGFIGELTAGGYRLNVRADDWGYANRDVRGRPGVKSNHAWGLAVDLNATTNPMTNDGRNHTDLPPGVSKLAAKYGLRWGGDYSGRKDPMHFEFIGTPADAQEYCRHLFGPNITPKEHSVAALISEDGKKIYGFDGVRVWHVPEPKTLAAVKKTGVYGNNTVYAVPVGTIESLEKAER